MYIGALQMPMMMMMMGEGKWGTFGVSGSPGNFCRHVKVREQV